MTLAQIATYCTNKLGITDTVTVALAKDFVQQRWRMLWNAYGWRQARHQQALTVSAGTQDVTLDSAFEFVTAARWAANQELLPVNDLSALSTNPVGYDQQGTVASFTQLPRDSSGNVVIRLFSTPAETKALLVIGKRKVTDLGDSDSPTLIGAAEALCAYTMADLYQWQRQLGKAQAFLEEASALFAKMVEIETSQTGELRRIIPIEQTLEEDSPALWW